ncbi:unnamed protein product [Alopecurus aequalis]
MARGWSRQSPPPIRSATRGRVVPRGSTSQGGSSRCRCPPPIRSADPLRSMHAGSGSSSRASGGDIELPAELPPPPPPQRYLGVRQRACGSWVVEITNRVTHNAAGSAPTSRRSRWCTRTTGRPGISTARRRRSTSPRASPPARRQIWCRLTPAARGPRGAGAARGGACQYQGLVEQQHAKMEEFRAQRRGPPGRVKEEPVVVKQEPRWGHSAGVSSSGAGPSSTPSVVDLTGKDSYDGSID